MQGTYHYQHIYIFLFQVEHFTLIRWYIGKNLCIMQKIMEGDRISLRFKLHKTKLPTSSDMEPPLQALFNFNPSMGK